MTSGRAEGRFRVVLTGAFSTGTPLRVPVSKYSELQSRLGVKMNPAQGEKPWNPEGVRWLERSSYDEGGGGYSNLVPLVLIQREGGALTRDVARREDAGWEAGSRGPADEDVLRSPVTRGWEWSLREVRVQLFDLGVGVIVGVYEARVPADVPLAEAAKLVRSWCNLTRDDEGAIEPPIGAAYEAIARDSVKRFREGLQACEGELPEPWLPPTLTAASESGESDQGEDGEQARERRRRSEEAKERGRLKWLHPVFVLAAPDSASEAEMRERAEPFMAVHSRPEPFEHGLFVPGIKRSVVVLEGDEREDDLLGPSTPLGLITLNWAYYALFMDIDRGLLAILDGSRRDPSAPFQQLEAEAKRTYEDYVRVAEAKARLDSALNGLGAGQVGLWDAIVKVTNFTHLIESVESKLDVLQTIAESRVQEAAAKGSRRSRRILSGLTALTLVTFAFALVSHFLGGQSDSSGHDYWRLAAFLVALALAVGVFVMAEWDLRLGTNSLRAERLGSAPADE